MKTNYGKLAWDAARGGVDKAVDIFRQGYNALVDGKKTVVDIGAELLGPMLTQAKADKVAKPWALVAQVAYSADLFTWDQFNAAMFSAWCRLHPRASKDQCNKSRGFWAHYKKALWGVSTRPGGKRKTKTMTAGDVSKAIAAAHETLKAVKGPRNGKEWTKAKAELTALAAALDMSLVS